MQLAAHSAPQSKPYSPSKAVIRLANAVDRGLENPEKPEDVIALILQSASARYDCIPSEPIEIDSHRLDMASMLRAVSYITITPENEVTVTF